MVTLLTLADRLCGDQKFYMISPYMATRRKKDPSLSLTTDQAKAGHAQGSTRPYALWSAHPSS